MIEKKDVKSAEECACVKEPDWRLECSNLRNELSDAHAKISDLERDKDVFISELAKVVTANQYLRDNLKRFNRRWAEYTKAFSNIKEIVERASGLNKSDKEKILSILKSFITEENK